ncbi:MAG: DUF4351 domain-containing protein [Thermodesulfobacteriota bacterium]|nr:DUF4351 domain-containing protein [Thermodesulfobacteriota bacterium]
MKKSFAEKIIAYEEERKMPFISSVEEIGMEKGLEKGREGFQRLLSKQLSYKLRLQPKSLNELLEDLSMEQMEKLGSKIFEVKNIEDIKIWINEITKIKTVTENRLEA